LPEETINIGELQVILNKFDTYKVSYPLFPKFQLFESNFEEDGYKVRISAPDFNRQLEKYEEFQEELPNYPDFRECFLTSGCITYTNVEEFQEKLKFYRGLHRKVYFALDTNILYHCFVSRSSIRGENVLIAPTVKEEIRGAMNYKYSRQDLCEFKSKIKFQSELVDELLNGRKKKSRKAAYLAQNELKKLHSLSVEEIEFNVTEYERNDLKIIRELKNFERKNNVLVVFLTADRILEDLCEIEGLEYFLFHYPDRLETFQCTPSTFRSLLYTLAVVFGFIKLNSVIIFGEFRGKTQLDTLKIRFLDEKIFKECQRDLRICRKLLALNIEF